MTECNVFEVMRKLRRELTEEAYLELLLRLAGDETKTLQTPVIDLYKGSFPRVRTTPDESYGNCCVCNKPRTSNNHPTPVSGYCGCVGYCDCQDASDT